jgi:hypothetical protein
MVLVQCDARTVRLDRHAEYPNQGQGGPVGIHVDRCHSGVAEPVQGGRK